MEIKKADTDKISSVNFAYSRQIAASNFVKVLRDCWYVERFDIDRATEKVEDDQIITLYQTDVDIKQLLAKFDYLISMSVTDLSTLTRDDILKENLPEDAVKDMLIPHPSNEPIVGVIDTQFNESVYFHEWVDYRKMINEDIPLQAEDLRHCFLQP